MATTVNVLCYKSKTLSNGEHPLMIRICKDGKKKYVSLGVSVKAEHWNFEKNVPKSNCPNREHINILIANKKKEYETEIVKLKSEDKLFTANTLNEQISNSVKPKTVEEAFKEYLRLLQEENRRGYMLSVKQVYNSLIKYNKHLNIHFTDIDVAWLKKYETWLRNNGLAENTIGIRFRTLRTIYNYAIQEDMVKAEHYPFKKYKVSKLNQETAKRALSKEDINRVLQYQTDNRFMRLPIDLFAFTYYMGGINFVDIANLTQKNIIDNRLVYKRSKTGKLIKLPLVPQAVELIKKYHSKNNPYLFPIFSNRHKTEQEKANRLHKVITKVNKRLKQIGEELGIPIPITTYVARHSQATIMKKAGISTAIIGQIMGWKIQCKLPPKTKRFYPLKTFNNAPLKSLDRWGYYYFSLFPSVCSHFTDTFSCQLNPVRRMYNTIHNGICYCRVSDCIIPIVRWQLRGDDDGLAPMSVLYYIEQDGAFLGIKVHKEEVIQYEQRAPFDSLEFRFQCAFYFCHLKRTHKFRSIRIICPYALLAGFIPHCCGKEALPGTG